MPAAIRFRRIDVSLLLAGLSLGVTPLSGGSGVPLPPGPSSEIRFERNVGQFDSAYDAVVRQGGSLVLIGADRVRIQLANGHEAEPVDLRMRLAGASPDSADEFEDPLLLIRTRIRPPSEVTRDPWKSTLRNPLNVS